MQQRMNGFFIAVCLFKRWLFVESFDLGDLLFAPLVSLLQFPKAKAVGSKFFITSKA